MKLSDYDYDLPEELIAQSPVPRRDASRLLVLRKSDGHIEHRKFGDLLDYLRPDDLLIINNSKVIPARLRGFKDITRGKVEILLNRQIDDNTWEVIGKGLKAGARISFEGGRLKASVIEKKDQVYQLLFNLSDEKFFDELEKIGEVPLPPYIKRSDNHGGNIVDRDRYQTVFAKDAGSVAAPTAGLHFTPELLHALSNAGINIAELTLHVGLGTFAPVKSEKIEQHKMHKEYFSVSAETIDKIRKAKQRGSRVIAVGTTTSRVLETISKFILNGGTGNIAGFTEIFIYPPYEFQVVDALITNFHLPKSTLLMLISALAGSENVKKAYREAIERRYRFFSYGDAMFIF